MSYNNSHTQHQTQSKRGNKEIVIQMGEMIVLLLHDMDCPVIEVSSFWGTQQL
jgi:hypothetical protein